MVLMPRILWVDDEPLHLFVFICLLEKAMPAARVEVVSTFDGASKLMEAQPFDLVVLDWYGPAGRVGRALEMISAIRKGLFRRAGTPEDAPVVVVSAGFSVAQQACKAGAFFFNKPIEVSLMLAVFATALRVPFSEVGLADDVSRGIAGPNFEIQEAFEGSSILFKALNFNFRRTEILKRIVQDGRQYETGELHGLVKSLKACLAILAEKERPNLVRVFDMYPQFRKNSPADIFVRMELIEGLCLEEAIASDEGLGYGRAAGIAYCISLAIWSLHVNGMIHGNLKPSNIFLREDGEVVVSDACYRDDCRCILRTNRRNTIYDAPEFSTKSSFTEFQEVYSLGRVLYYCFFGTAGLESADGYELDSGGFKLPRQLRSLLSQMVEEEAASRPTLQSVCGVLSQLPGMPPAASSNVVY